MNKKTKNNKVRVRVHKKANIKILVKAIMKINLIKRSLILAKKKNYKKNKNNRNQFKTQKKKQMKLNYLDNYLEYQRMVKIIYLDDSANISI